MHPRVLAMFFTAFLLVSACTPGSEGQQGSSSSSETSVSSQASDLPETMNVTYTGTLEALTATPSADASHQLVMDSGRNILVQSTDINLQLGSYVGKRVDVRGSLNVSGSAPVLRVTEVTVLGQESSSASRQMCGGIAALPCPEGLVCVDDPSDSCNPDSGGADCSGVCTQSSAPSSPSSVDASASSSSSSLAVKPTVPSSSSSSVAKTPVSSASSSSSAAPAIAPSEPVVAQMAKQSYATSGIWTQKYCTGHVGFCVPVHKNWYYKSFGATTSTLWHVEFGISEIDALGQGGISLNLISGTAESAGGIDGKTEEKAGIIVGYKNWDGGKHIQIAADARLTEAVTYMLDHLERYAPNE